jgi:hypothetical protein
VEQLTSMVVNPAGDEPFRALGTVAMGTTLQIFFGAAPVGFVAHATERIFDNSPLEGVRVTLNTGAVLTACCDGTRTCLGEAALAPAPAPEPALVAEPAIVTTPVPRKRKKDSDRRKDKKKR